LKALLKYKQRTYFDFENFDYENTVKIINAVIFPGVVKINKYLYQREKAVIAQDSLFGMLCNNCNFQRLP